MTGTARRLHLAPRTVTYRLRADRGAARRAARCGAWRRYAVLLAARDLLGRRRDGAGRRSQHRQAGLLPCGESASGRQAGRSLTGRVTRVVTGALSGGRRRGPWRDGGGRRRLGRGGGPCTKSVRYRRATRAAGNSVHGAHRIGRRGGVAAGIRACWPATAHLRCGRCTDPGARTAQPSGDSPVHVANDHLPYTGPAKRRICAADAAGPDRDPVHRPSVDEDPGWRRSSAGPLARSRIEASPARGLSAQFRTSNNPADAGRRGPAGGRSAARPLPARGRGSS